VDDIIQAGLIGLMDAAGRFDATRGNPFEPYASHRIQGAMLDLLRRDDWTPRSVRKAFRAIEAAIARLEQQLGRAPREAEVAQSLGLPLAQYQRLLGESRGHRLVPIETMAADEQRESGERFDSRESADPLAELECRRRLEAVTAAIGELPHREKHVVAHYYEQDKTFREIATTLKVSESRVCQLHGKGVARLRAKLRHW
jgi:RNA polymerase sigma factor for flagellar operon FliA